MGKLNAIQILLLLVQVVGVIGLGVALFLDGSTLAVRIWGVVTLVGLVGNALVALLRISQQDKRN